MKNNNDTSREELVYNLENWLDPEHIKRIMNLIDQHTKTMCETARIETLQNFAEYAHTRYKGCTQDEYAYDSEVVIMVDDYVELQSSPNKREGVMMSNTIPTIPEDSIHPPQSSNPDPAGGLRELSSSNTKQQIEEILLLGLANHSNEFLNPGFIPGMSHKELADVLKKIMSSRLPERIETLIDRLVTEAYKKGYIDGGISQLTNKKGRI